LIKKLVQSTFNKFGYRVVSDRPRVVPQGPYGLEGFLSLLNGFGFDPKHIIDVGANKGTWTRTALQFFPDARYTLFEPQDHLKSHIQDLFDRGYKITWISEGVADQPGSLPFRISHRDDSSSFICTPADADNRISVPVTTLNEIASSTAEPLPEMVKIDAEGFDLRVLAGASDLLGKTDVFFVEVAIGCLGFENTIANVIRTMDEAGYHVVDITDINRSPKFGVLWLCELAFLRNASPLFSSVTSYE
jgi:FkbM family methyltransferase